jgi:hypothetical protein
MDTVIPLDILTSVFGSGIGGDIEKSLAGAVGAVGGLFDGALDFIPVMDFLPGGGDIAGIYGRLPEDELKAQYDQLIAAQPTARLEYMKQYLDRRGADIARMHGFSGDMGELAGPSSSFSEQLRRIIFGGLMLAGNQTAKAYINNGSLRDVEGTILNKDDSLLPAELVEMKQRLENGEITRDEFNDELSAGQFRWTHDTGAGGMFINLVMDIVSDPLIWASFGIGGVAKAGASGAVRTAMLRTTQAVRKAGMEERMAAALSRTHRMAPEDIIKSGSDEMLKAKYEWAKQNAGTAYQEGIASMGRTQRTLYKLDPIIKPAAKVANEVDSLFGMFGATHVGRRLSAFRGVKHVEGVSRAVGVKRVQRTQNFFGPELFDDFTSWFGIATANLSGKLSQKLEVDSLLAHNRAVDQAGARIGGLMKDPDVTPTQAAKSFVASSMEEGLPREAEQAFLQYMETFLPHGEQTAAGVQAAMRQAKQALAADLAAAKGTDVRTALKHLDGADRRELAFLHFVLYGRQVKMFNLAKLEHVQSIKGHLDNARRAGDDAEVARLTDELADAERLTLVSENLLTRSDAQTVLAAVHSPGEAGVRAAKQAVERFDQLDINWGGRAMDGEALRIELKQHLEAMLAEEGRLTSVIDPSAVHPRIAGSLDTRYRVGHAPTDVWGIVRDADGTIKSVNPFVEAMSNVDSSLSRNLSWYDRMKQGLAGPMSGARLHAEAKMRMRVVAATEFGMRKQDADALFNAINRESIIRQKGARGFGAHELNEIAKQASVTLDPSLHVKYGDRAILDLVLRAYEGDLAMLGTSSHLSSRVKSKFGRLPLGDNLLGKIAEDFYPKLRFSASPIFLAMEWVEGPFFAILRGVKPGWRYGADDVRMNSILRTIQPDYAENGAGIGRAQLAYGDNIGAMKVSQASMMTRTWNKLMPAKFKRNPVRLQGPRWYNVYEMKKLLYVRQAGKDASRRWTAQMKQEFPDALHQWEQAAGSTKPEKVFMAFMEERGAFDPSARHALHMFDAAKPDSMGKERIRMGDVAQWQGHTTAAAMREAINNGSLTESQFMTRYTDVGMNETYARRAWNIASGFTEAEWDAALVEALGKEAAEGAINFHKWIANAKGISIEEFLNDEYGQVAQVVNSSRLVPGVALKQTVRASLEGINATVHERGSKLHTAAKRRSSDYLPESTREVSPTVAALDRVAEVKATLTDDSPAFSKTDEAFHARRQAVYEASWETGTTGLKKTPAKKKGGGVFKQVEESNGSTHLTFYDTDGTLSGNMTLNREGHVMIMEILPSKQKAGLSGAMFDAFDKSLKGKLEEGLGYGTHSEAGKAAALKWLKNKQETMGAPGSRLTNEIDIAQRSVNNGGGRPPGLSKRRQGMLSERLKDREKVYEDMFVTMRSAFGGNEQVMRDAANWYDEMTTMFLGLAEKMPDSMVDALMRQWDESANTPTARRAGGAPAKALADMTKEEKQVELAARLNIAFSGSQMNTSVLGGMQYVAKMLDEVFEDKDIARLRTEAEARLLKGDSKKARATWEAIKKAGDDADAVAAIIKDTKNIHLVAEFMDEATTAARKQEIIDGKVETRFGFKVVGRRMEDLLRDFGNMDPEKIAQKLSDFNDNLAGRTTRTSSPVSINGVPLQPAAMDIWMKRIYGFGDDAYLGYLTDDYMRVHKMDVGDPKARAKAEKAVRKEENWGDGDLGKGDAPTEAEYEWMLERTNEFKDWLNKEGIEGPNGEWAAHEIQAMLWVGEQKRLQYEGTPTAGVLTQTGAQLSPVNKTRTSPQLLELVAEHGDEAAQIMDAVQRDINTPLMAAIAEATGVVNMRTLDGAGLGSTNVVFSGREASMRAAAHMAAALDEPVVRIGNGGSHHTVDVSFDPVMTGADTKPYITPLSDYLAEHMPNHFTHMSTALLDSNAMAVRSVTKKNIAGSKTNPLPFDQLPPDVMAALEDGSWVKAFDPDADPMPVKVDRGRVDFDVITPEEGRTLVGDAELVNQYRSDAIRAEERAFAHHAPESATKSATRAALADGDTKPQRNAGGDVRAGFKPATNAEKAALYFVNNAVDATSGVHEAFHLFARHIDGSAKRELIDAYNRAHGLTGRQRKRSFSVVEEWVAAEFEAFAAGDIRPDATYAGTFKSFAEWGQKHPGIRRESVVAPVFDRVLEAWADTPGGFTSLDERRIWESARISLLRAEEEAHATAYYRRSPNFIGRSLNHPYLGMYPANYMWGKVLPELTRFLLRKPFGVNAPLGGMMMYNHVHRAIAEQLATDEDFNQYIEDHPDTIRFMTMMLPGNPVEMPVNLPVVARRAMEHDAENRARVHAGQEPEQFDLAGSVGDMVSYSVGYANLAGRVGDMFGEWAGGDGPNAGRTAPRYEITDDVL